MDEEYIKAIHAAYGEDKLGSYDDFYSEITSNKDYRDLVYNQLGGADVFGEYADFEDLVSIKQEDTQKKKTTQPYQPTSEEPTQVSRTDSEDTNTPISGVIPKPIGAFDEPVLEDAELANHKGIDFGALDQTLPSNMMEAQEDAARRIQQKQEQQEVVSKGRKAQRVIDEVSKLSTNIGSFEQSQKDNPDYVAIARDMSFGGGVIPKPIGAFDEPVPEDADVIRREQTLSDRLAFSDDINAYTQSELQKAKPQLDKEYQNLTGIDFEQFVVEQPDGTLAVDPNALYEVEFYSDNFQKLHKELVDNQARVYENASTTQKIGGELSAGASNLYNGVFAWFDPESANVTTIINDAKLRGIKKAKGLSDEQIDRGIIKNFKDGDVEAGLINLTSGVVSNLPQIGLAIGASMADMPNVGLATLGASAGGAAFADLSDNPNVPVAMKYLIGAEIGAVEALTEKLFYSDVRLARQMLSNLSSTSIRQMSKRIARDFVSEGMIPVKEGAKEAVEEAIASVNEQVIRNFIEGKPIDLYEVGDAAIIGFGSGGGIGMGYLVSKTPSYIGSYKTANKRRDVLSKIRELGKIANDEASTAEEVAIAEQGISEARRELVRMAAIDDAMYETMSDADVQEVMRLNRNIRRNLDLLDKTDKDVLRSEIKRRLQSDFDAKKEIEQRQETQATPLQQEEKTSKEDKKADIERRRQETEAKIKNKSLFLAEVDENGNKVGESVGEMIAQSDVAPVPTSVREVNGYEFVEFSNPESGQVDVIVTGDTKGNYVGFYRLYENGKPTNKWSSKMKSSDKNAFKTMMSGVQQMLPQGHEYTEKTSISTDGLRVWGQQLSRGYELQYDNNGNLITNRVAINGDAIVNELGIDVNRGNFDNISVTNKEQFDSVKKALLQYLQKFGLNENNIYWTNGTVKIDLPVLRNTEKSEQRQETQATPLQQEEQVAEEQPMQEEAEEELSFFEDIVEGGASEARRVYDEEKARVEANAEAEVERIVSGQEAMAETEAREAQRKANIAEATVTGETMAVEREAAKPSKREGDKAKPKDLTKTEGEQDFTEAERPTPVTSAPATRTPEQEKMGAMVSRAKEAQRKARQERANKKAVEEAVKTPPTAEVSEDIGPEVDFVTDDELADAMVQGAETPSVNDKILNILDKAIDATSTKGRAFDATLGLPMFMANSALKIVRAAYKGGMSLADAVKKGYNFVRSQGYELDLDAFDAYVKQSLTGKKETEDAVQEQTAGEVPVQPEAEVGGEMEEGVPDTEPQEATQEGEGEQELSALETAQTKVQLPSIKAAMPFLDGFDITKLTEDQINLLNEVMETYLETGELVGDGTLRAIVEGIQGAESNGPNAKMTADSLDIRAGEYLNLIAAIMGRNRNAWIRLQRELGLTGDNGLTIGLTKASAFRNNFYEIIERVTGNKVYEKGTESRVQVVGIVLQRIGQMVGDRNTVEQVINDVLDDFQATAEYLKVYGDPSLGDYASNIEKAVAKVRGATTADEVMAKLSPKEKEVLEVYYEANNVGIDEKIEVSRANGRPLKVIPNYLHIPIRSKTVVEPQNNTPTNNTLSNPAQINISNAFAPQTVSTRSTGAQQSRVANAHKLPEGSYYDPMFFSAQAKSFNNTNVAIFTYQAIQKMNAFLSTGEAVERFGGGKRGRSNIEAFQKSVNQALNAESLSAKASVELREFKVSGVKVGETLNTLQRIAKKRGIVWVMARPAQFFLQAPVFINTIGHVLMSPLMLKNPIAAMAVLQRAIVFQTQTWTKEKGWQNRRGLPWADLIKLAPAGIRDIRESFAFMEGDSEDVISRRSGITNKAIRVYDKADDAALKYSVAVTDRASAQMSWLALYESYMLENGLVGGDVDLTNRESYNEWWKSQGQNPNYDAIAYADTMVAKDQNASANFQRAILQTDKSAFEKLFRSLVFPLINFKINKIQSIRSESKIISTINKKVTAEDRLLAGGRLLFTAAEMYVYHQASIFLVGAWKDLVDSMWKSAIDFITGDDDDEIFDEDDMGKTIKNQKRFWTRWITESAPLLSTLNIDQRMQNGIAEAYNFMCYQFNKQTDTAFASQYPEYESYARSGEAPAKVEFMDEGIGNAGYLGIVAEQVMTIDEMWEAAMNGERENQYGEMVYYTPKQQQSLKFTATLATINSIMPSHPLTAEVFGMVNRSFYKENNKAYENMLARDLETIGKGIPEEDEIAIMNSYIQTTYKDLFEQEGITALTAIGESLKRDVGNVVKREVLKESFKSLYNSEDAKINEFLVRASRGGSPRDKANKIFARIKALDKMGETEKRDKLAYEAYVLSLKGITVGKDQGLSIVLLLDAYNYNKNVLGGKSFLELSTEMSKKYAKNKERPYSTKGFTP